MKYVTFFFIVLTTALSFASSSSDSEDDSTPIPLNCTPAAPVWNFDNPAAAFYTIDICDGLYVYGNGLYNGFFLVSRTGVIFVDAPPSMSSSLPHIVGQVTSNPITTVIYSHHHYDHIGGASQIPNIENARIVCHSRTNGAILARPEHNIPLCTEEVDLNKFNERARICDDDKFVVLRQLGFRFHSNDDLFIFAPKQRSIYVVDLVYPKWIPFKQLAMATDPEGWRAAHDALLAITSRKFGDWRNLVAGHVDQLGTRDDVRISAQYYDDMFDALETALADPKLSFGAVLVNQFGGVVDGTNQWDIIKAYQDGIANECVRILQEEQHWDQRLNGWQAYSYDNCYAVYQEIQINLGF